MTSTFAVKAGVSLPPAAPKGRAKYPFETMKVDEVFFVPGGKGENLSAYTSKVGKRLRKQFKTRTISMRLDLTTNEWEPCKPTEPGARQGVAIQRVG